MKNKSNIVSEYSDRPEGRYQIDGGTLLIDGPLSPPVVAEGGWYLNDTYRTYSFVPGGGTGG